MNRSRKIPYGFHKASGELKTAHPGSVKKGEGCGCICPECEEPLVAAQGDVRTPYFRHKNDSPCKGSLESWMHKEAKSILQEATSVRLEDDNLFFYTGCNIEKEIYGKRPDACLTNDRGERVIVEVDSLDSLRRLSLVSKEVTAYRDLQAKEMIKLYNYSS